MGDSQFKFEQDYLQKRDDMILNPRDTQSIFFKDNREGPFYLSGYERVARKYNKPTGKTGKRRYMEAELIQLLNDKGHLIPPSKNVTNITK